MEVSPLGIALLTVAAFVAGLLDAIAGGGGLITLPALLAAGLPPHLALGTNKGQSVFGSGAAVVRFARAGLISPQRARWTFPLGFAGSLLGGLGVLEVSPTALRPVVIALLGIAAALVLLKPRALRSAAVPPHRALLAGGATALLIGAYDGFFGPGTGTFLILAFVSLLGMTPVQASAEAKVVNFASNLAAVVLFGSRGVVLWEVALPMAVGQAVGGWVGAHAAVKVGDRLVRGAILVVVAALMTKLTFDMLS